MRERKTRSQSRRDVGDASLHLPSPSFSGWFSEPYQVTSMSLWGKVQVPVGCGPWAEMRQTSGSIHFGNSFHHHAWHADILLLLEVSYTYPSHPFVLV